MQTEVTDISVSVQQLTPGDIDKIIDIHLENFPFSRSSLLGRRFVKKMYMWFFNQQPNLALVARANGDIAGFVVGAIGGYGRAVFRYALPEIIAGIISNPRIIVKKKVYVLWTSYVQALVPLKQGKKKSVQESILKASIASIATTEAAQRQGVGKALVGAFQKAAKTQGVDVLGLSVESTNTPARKLYESCGWQLARQNANMNSVYYKKYI
jgi:ribosomal protein S18 acetylase RimI-like enzyme